MALTNIFHTDQIEGAKALASLLKEVSLGDVAILDAAYDGRYTITVKHEKLS